MWEIKSLGGEPPVAEVFPSTSASPNPAARSVLLPALPYRGEGQGCSPGTDTLETSALPPDPAC